MIVPPPFVYLFNTEKNTKPFFNPEVVFKTFIISSLSLSLILTNGYVAHETSQKIKNMLTIERKIEEANRLKEDFKDNWYFAPFTLGEYFVAERYLKDYQ